ncbi:HAD-like domain-containing protein [Boletus reticuloceps]|uniref:P-type Cu(+) transporter n=1 Tax=Boletus reticuloceps TaxID=495285 RepID=A0A8I2YDV8_9AGAM|nr:HAD-like domain-containing protein [Boletus reticuloceps]
MLLFPKTRIKLATGTPPSRPQQSTPTLKQMCRGQSSFMPTCRSEQSSLAIVRCEDLACEQTPIGIVGIEDPPREGVRQAVADCQKAGVTVKMCTGDNVLTAHSIASQCGIFTTGDIVMEGPIFRKLNDAEMLNILPRQVLTRSSPEDKRILVERLRSLGEIVTIIGDGTNDRPALKIAHIGFSMVLRWRKILLTLSSWTTIFP